MENNNLNIDPNMMGKLQDMMQNGDLNNVLSQIPPDMLQNFSSMVNNQNTTNANVTSNESVNNNMDMNNIGNMLNGLMKNLNQNQSNQSTNSNTSNNSGGFDFSNIDMNTLLKMKSIMEKMNGNNDPRSNLLHSLKPYLRDEKKEKVDQYANLLNMTKLAELFNNQNNSNTPNT